MLIFVNDDNMIIGCQENPNNGLTLRWMDDDDDLEIFDPSDYEKCVLITE